MNSADQMVRSALLRLIHLDSHKYSGNLLWAAAADLFGVGSTSAIALCRQHKLDPDSRLPESSMTKLSCKAVEIEENDDLPFKQSYTQLLQLVEELSTRD